MTEKQAELVAEAQEAYERGQQEDPPKPPRLCSICGARVTSINAKCTTCSTPCTLAKRYSITRERAQRMFGVGRAGHDRPGRGIHAERGRAAWCLG